MSLMPALRPQYERSLAATRAQLDEATFNAAWAAGRKMTMEQAIAEAQRVTTEQPIVAPPAPAPTHPAGLSAREVEVLRWLAKGLSDAEIAEQLVISVRTVHGHLRSIYSKLDVTSRTAAVRVATESKII